MRALTRQRNGAALFTVLAIVLIVSGILSVTLMASMQRTFAAHNLIDRMHAKTIAEAGANQAYTVLVTNYAARNDVSAFPPTPYAGGHYDVAVKPVGTRACVIHSTGTYNSAVCDVIMDVKDFGSDGSPAPGAEPAYDYAMLCGGRLRFRGCGEIASTNGQSLIHANGVLSIAGDAKANVHVSSSTLLEVKNPRTIDGNATATDFSLHNKTVITGTKTKTHVKMVTIPDIDFTPYYNWASQHGEVKNGFSMSGGTYAPNGGVLWVNGDVHLSGHYTFNGSIIATGSIKLAGQGDVTATTCAFSVATRDGPWIQNQSSGTITGLMYAKNGDYTHTANGQVVGQVIIQGDIDKAGNSDVFLYGKYVPTAPGSGAPPTSLIALTAWQK